MGEKKEKMGLKLFLLVAAAHAHQLGETVESPLNGKPLFQNASSLLMTSAHMSLMKSGIGSAPDTTCYCRKTSLDCLHILFNDKAQVDSFITCVTAGAGSQGSSAGGMPDPIGSDTNGQSYTTGWCISEAEYKKANGDSTGCSMALESQVDCDTTTCLLLDTSTATNDGSLNGLTQGYKAPEDPSSRFPDSCQGQAYQANLSDACGGTGNNDIYDQVHATASMLLSKEEAHTFLKKNMAGGSPEEEAEAEPEDDAAAEPADEINLKVVKTSKVVQT